MDVHPVEAGSFSPDPAVTTVHLHSGSTVECVPGGLVLPVDLALVGLQYTAQGVCTGGSVRLSNALTQTIGN